MAGIVNVNYEMNEMKKNVGDIHYCASKITEVKDQIATYRAHFWSNLFAIISTIYTISCLFVHDNTIMLGVGIGVGALTLIINTFPAGNPEGVKWSGIFSCLMVASSIGIYMYSNTLKPMWISFFVYENMGNGSTNLLIKLFDYVPYILMIIVWLIVLGYNFKFSRQISRISKSI